MTTIDFFKKEIKSLSTFERVFFLSAVTIIFITSLLTKDNKLALISSICGICYTILAGKGKIYCYFIGMIGTFIYSYLSFKNTFYGNFALYFFYYFPMEIIGICKWKKHLKPNTVEIKKTSLTKKELTYYSLATTLMTIIFAYLLTIIGDKNPIIDATATIFSITGMLLTVKRCIEQWYIWIIVNTLSLIMWLYAYLDGSNSLAIVFMWLTYLILGFYFLIQWKKEINKTGR